jgi:hypothetical protein
LNLGLSDYKAGSLSLSHTSTLGVLDREEKESTKELEAQRTPEVTEDRGR